MKNHIASNNNKPFYIDGAEIVVYVTEFSLKKSTSANRFNPMIRQ